MMKLPYLYIFLLTITLLSGCEKEETDHGSFQLLQLFVGSQELPLDGAIMEGIAVDRPITLNFSTPVDQASAEIGIALLRDGNVVDISHSYQNENKTVVIYPVGALLHSSNYTLELSNQLQSANGASFIPNEISFKTSIGDLEIVAAEISEIQIEGPGVVPDVPFDFQMSILFNYPIDESTVQNAVKLIGQGAPAISFSLSNNDKTLTISGATPLDYLRKYTFTISDELTGSSGEDFSGYELTFYTMVDETPKFEVVSDEVLLTMVQEQTFTYFWDFAHPVSGLARERSTSGDVVTIGGSGFGVMAIIVGIERGFITRQEGIDRLTTMVNFLGQADRFHGVWPHWMNGETGNVIPFSAKDNGGDLVETAFMVQGLLTLREYLDPNVPGELILMNDITELWEAVEWDWYTRDGQDVLYWHWSPEFEWEMNHKIEGYNEALIVSVLAASSPTHSISTEVYEVGWAKNGGIVNGNTYYGHVLPLGYSHGGPLFFSHYSFLGLDPRNLSDQYANYWEQNVRHSLINYSYCADNPKNYIGYSENCWGLTASDNHIGYSAHSPTNDLGVITPTAALSSFPFTPEESMAALKFFYYTMGDRLWKDYGFVDAFNITEEWYADSFLAIDQGPIIVMIENHRTALIWDLLMQSPEVQAGLDKLNFNY